MIALLDNMQILVINKKLVNKLHSVGLVTLWLGVTQGITNGISNFVTVVIILRNVRLVTVTILLTRYICK